VGQEQVKTGLRIVAVCFAFGVCLAIGGALAGVARHAPKQAPGQAAPLDLLLPLAVFCLSVGSVVSYLVLRSSWRGLRLAGTLFAATYGISTVATQVESLFFLCEDAEGTDWGAPCARGDCDGVVCAAGGADSG